jgi:hypothetical protein
MISFLNSRAPLVESDLDEVESRFGFRFPQEFRDLYLAFNGGTPEKNRFIDEKGQSIFHELLPIKF